MGNWKCWPWPGRALNLLAKLACACMCENSRYYGVSLGFCCSISRLFIHWTEFNYIRPSEQMMLLMLASKTVTDLGCRTKKSECMYDSFLYGHLHAPINAAKSHLPKLIAIKRRRAQESTIFSCSAIADDWSAIEFKVHLWCQNCLHRDRQIKTVNRRVCILKLVRGLPSSPINSLLDDVSGIQMWRKGLLVLYDAN